jgi:hypothetical protein
MFHCKYDIALLPLCYARPKSLRFGSAVPTNNMGKRADWAVEETFPAS